MIFKPIHIKENEKNNFKSSNSKKKQANRNYEEKMQRINVKHISICKKVNQMNEKKFHNYKIITRKKNTPKLYNVCCTCK